MAPLGTMVLVPAAALAALVVAPRPAQAGAAVYVQGRGVAGADSTAELTPGAMTPAHGSGLGWRIGARLLFLEGEVSHTDFGDGAAADQAVVGVASDLSLGNVRVRGSAGLGAMRLDGGALGVVGAGATGPLARLAAALEFDLGAGFWFGAEIETTAYRLTPEGGSVIDDADTGKVVLGSLQLGFEFGL